MAVRTERLAAGDEARLRELRLTALQSDPDAFYRTHAEEVDQPTEFWSAWLARAGTVLLVAVDEGRDVGIGGLVPDRHAPEELAVITFWVDPRARGRGVGRALLDALVREARALGAPAVTLEVADANGAAVRLYAAAGFEHTGRTGAFAPPREHVTEHQRRLVLDVLGPRVRLVPATRSQLAAVADGRDPVPLVAGEGWPHADTLDAVRPALEALVAWTWFVEVDGRVVGDCGLLGPPSGAAAEIGYGLAASVRGRGLGTELVGVLSTYLLGLDGIDRITATVERGDNAASHAVLRRNGFRPAGAGGYERPPDRSEEGDGALDPEQRHREDERDTRRRRPAPAAAGRTGEGHHDDAEQAEEHQEAVRVEVEGRERRAHAEQPEVDEVVVEQQAGQDVGQRDRSQDLRDDRARLRLGGRAVRQRRDGGPGGRALHRDDGGALGEDRGHAMTVAAGGRPRPGFGPGRVPVPTPSGPTGPCPMQGQGVSERPARVSPSRSRSRAMGPNPCRARSADSLAPSRLSSVV